MRVDLQIIKEQFLVVVVSLTTTIFVFVSTLTIVNQLKVYRNNFFQNSFFIYK